MFKFSYLIFIFGLFFLFLSLLNAFTSGEVSPALQRAESISAIASICLIAIGIYWQDITPKNQEIALLNGSEGFDLSDDLNNLQKNELAWGSELILTATAASTILIYWEGKTILKRGIITESNFIPGEVCLKSKEQSRLISLVNTSLFPGRYEFDSVVKDLPSLIVCPLSNNGWTIVGGWSKRCFTKSDEIWISGWCKKISELLKTNQL